MLGGIKRFIEIRVKEKCHKKITNMLKIFLDKFRQKKSRQKAAQVNREASNRLDEIQSATNFSAAIDKFRTILLNYN
jgi:hypothetical protein